MDPTVPEGHKHRVTTPENPRKIPRAPAEPRRDPTEPSERPRGALPETPAEPSERQISSESLAEGCAPRMVTLRNFKMWRFPIWTRPCPICPCFLRENQTCTKSWLPLKTSENPADPRRTAPQNPRRDPAEPSERLPQSPLRGKFPGRASQRVVPLGW